MTSGWKRVRWTKAMRGAFLDTLAETCNIMVAAEAAGVRSQSAYGLRRRDAAFAEEWRQALACGYEVLETRLVGLAIALATEGGPREIDNGAHGRIDTDLALRMLTQHRNAMAGKVRGGGPPLKRATPEETDKAILRQLDAYERRLRAQQAEVSGEQEADVSAVQEREGEAACDSTRTS